MSNVGPSPGSGPGAPPGRAAPADAPRAPPAPLLAPTGSPGVNAVEDVINATAAPFETAPPANQGAAGVVSQGVGAVVGVIGAPAKIIDTAFAELTAPIAAMFPAFPACTLGAMHVGPPHTHTHPPSLIPPAPPVPLPSLGAVIGAGSVTVLVGGMPAARAGDIGMAVTCGSLAPPFEIYTGSSNVFIGGSRAARVMDITKHCNPTSVGFFDVAMAAAGAVAGCAGAIATGNPWAAVQAAADAAVMAIKMLLGKDPGLPPGMGMLVGPPVPTVLIGGFPCPPIGQIAVGELLKALKAAASALRKGSSESNGCTGNAGCPVYVVTGENFEKFLDFASGLFEWRRHYTTARAREDGPLGHGWRHFFQRSLRVRLHKASLTDWTGLRVEFPEFPYGEGVVRADGRVLTRLTRGHYRLSQRGAPDVDFSGNEFEGDLLPSRFSSPAREVLLHHDGLRRLVGAIERDRKTGATRRFEIRYDTAGHVTHVIERPAPTHEDRAPDALLRVACRYTAASDLAEVQDAVGGRWRYEYDAFHRWTKNTDARDYSYAYRYDVHGRCVETVGQDGLWTTRLEYFPEKGFTRVTEGEGGPREFHYDSDGVITKIVEPDGGVRLRERDAEGRLAREIDVGGREIRWLYDGAGAHHARVDRFGNLFGPEVEDRSPPNPFARSFPNTALGRLYDGTLTFSSRARLGADATLLRSLPSELSATARLAFRVRAPTDVAEIDLTPRTERDAKGRKVLETDAFGRTRAWTYDATGNVVAMRDRDGRTRTRVTTSWNLVGEALNALGSGVKYEYSQIEKVAAVIDPHGNRTRYDFDPKGRLARVHRNERVRDAYVYDVGDHLVEKRDGAGAVLFANEAHENHFVKMRRLASGGVHIFDYDERGRITQASTDRHDVQIAYDFWGRRLLDTHDGAGIEHEYLGGWSVASRLFGSFAWSSHRESNTIRLVDPAGRETRVTARDDGVVIRACSNGTTEVLQYDVDGRLLARLVYRAGPTQRWVTAYAYTPEGDLVQRDDSALGTTHFEVDEAHRLVAEVLPNGERRAFWQDAADNVRLVWLEIGPGNRLVRSADEVFVYDDRDRLSERQAADGSVVRYVYDSCEMLVRVERIPAFGMVTTAWEAEYDATGRRLRVRAAGQQREFYWDGDRLAAEVLPSGRLRVFQYATRTSIVPLGFVEYAGRDAPAAEGRSYHVFSDPVGMPLRIEDETGAVAWSADDVHPFGAIRVRRGATLEYNLRWPGHYYDPETGLHYNRYRAYDPRLGRYLQGDPLGYEGSPVNLYAYCGNPLIQVDVLGLHEDKSEEPEKTNSEPTQEKLPKPGGDENAPAREGDISDEDHLTSDQRKYFNQKIADAGSDSEKANQARYDRNVTARENRGMEPLEPADWVDQKNQMRANASRGSAGENAALDSLGLENNNTADDPKTYPKDPENPNNGERTRPDADNDTAVVDVKTVPDEPAPGESATTVNNEQQLRGQQAAAGDDRNHVTIISSGNPDTARPSGPLADPDTGSDAVYHHNPNNDTWSQWGTDKDGNQGWQPVDKSDVKDTVGTN